MTSTRSTWPGRRPRSTRYTLIDTPGLASLNDENSRRTRDFLEIDADRSERRRRRHLPDAPRPQRRRRLPRRVHGPLGHRGLAGQRRRRAVAGRRDRCRTARRDGRPSPASPARYRDDETDQRVVRRRRAAGRPAGRDRAHAARGRGHAPCARSPPPTPTSSRPCCCRPTSSATCTPATSPSSFAATLLDRLGMFGVRVALRGDQPTGRRRQRRSDRRLVEVSGLGELQRVIAEHFLPRARTLQARSALVALRSLARELRGDSRGWPTASTATPNGSRPVASSSPGSGPPTWWPRARPGCATASRPSWTGCSWRVTAGGSRSRPVGRRCRGGRRRAPCHRPVAHPGERAVGRPNPPRGVRDRGPDLRDDLRRGRGSLSGSAGSSTDHGRAGRCVLHVLGVGLEEHAVVHRVVDRRVPRSTKVAWSP